jgi:hypothetical protein
MDIAFLWVLGTFWFLKSMFIHIRRPVREQPDTEYRKSLLSYFVADPVFGGGCFWGGGNVGERLLEWGRQIIKLLIA